MQDKIKLLMLILLSINRNDAKKKDYVEMIKDSTECSLIDLQIGTETNALMTLNAKFTEKESINIDGRQYFCVNGHWESQSSENRQLTQRFTREKRSGTLNDALTGAAAGAAIGGAIGSVPGAIIGGVLGGLACFFLCKDDPPPNTPPYFASCPQTGSEHLADSGSTEKIITWTKPVGKDKEDGDLSVHLVSGSESGSAFSRGYHTIIYKVQDHKGLTAYCHFQFKVVVISCKPITWPLHGSVYCPQSEFIDGTSCTVRCNEGYEMIPTTPNNQIDITCTRDSSNNPTYDHTTNIQCKAIVCDGNSTKLQPENGDAYCTHDNFKFGSICLTQCDPGYANQAGAVFFAECEVSKTWSTDLPDCEDDEPPLFTYCPGFISVHADRGTNTANVTWREPTAVDNSGNVSVTLIKGEPSGSRFPVGFTEIQYTAKDQHGNVAPNCVFFVQVYELTCDPPLIEDQYMTYQCPDGFTYGAVCGLSCMGNFPLVGSNNITCEKEGQVANWEWDEPKQTCLRNPCEPLDPPENGAISCAAWLYGQQCQMQCESSYDIPFGAVDSNGASFTGQFVCSETTGKYIPSTVPGCTALRRPQRQYLDGEYFYYTGDCNDPSVQDSIKQNFIENMEQLQNNGWDGVCPSNTECNVGNVEVTCGPVTGRRKRRSPLTINLVRRSTHEIRVDFRIYTNSTESARTPIDDFYYKENIMINISERIRAKVQNGDLNVNGLTADASSLAVGFSEVVCPAGTSVRWSTITCVPCPPGTYIDQSTQKCMNCPIGSYKDNDLDSICTPCPAETSTFSTGSRNISECLEICSPGYYSTNGLSPCKMCPLSTFSNISQSQRCFACPTGKTTPYTGSTSDGNCSHFDILLPERGDEVLLGETMTAQNTMSMAFWLKFSSYVSSLLVSFSTTALPTTSIYINLSSINIDISNIKSTASVSLHYSKWTHLTLVIDTNNQNWKAYINGEKVIDMPINVIAGSQLYPTGSNISVVSDGNGPVLFSSLMMTENILTSSEVQNLASVCHIQFQNAFIDMDSLLNNTNTKYIVVPSHCDNMNECEPNPCNGFNCTDMIGGFLCHCSKGFTGLTCNIEPDMCTGTPCKNGGTCNRLSGDFNCTCAQGFKGKSCEITIVNGAWSSWGEWSTCSGTCAGGIMSRSRVCNSPAPDPDGVDCDPNDKTETASCNTEPCPSCPTIKRGYKNVIHCNLTSDGHQVCGVTCSAGYTFVHNHLPDSVYTCGPNTSYEWTNSPPACSKSRSPGSYTIRRTAYYSSLNCHNTDAAELALLQSGSNEYQCVKNNTCTMNVQSTGCDTGRRRRSSGLNVVITLTIPLQNGTDLELESLTSLENASHALLDLLTAVQEIEATALQLNDSASVTDITINGVTYATTSQTTSVIVSCDGGQGSVNAICVECPPGTYAHDSQCNTCALGSYQPSFGQTSCEPCPSGYTTHIIAATDVSACSVQENTTTTSPDPLQTKDISSSSASTSTAGKQATDISSSSASTSITGQQTTDVSSSSISTTTKGQQIDLDQRQGGKGDNAVILISLVSAVVALVAASVAVAAVCIVKKYKRSQFRSASQNGSFASLSMVKPQTALSTAKPAFSSMDINMYTNMPPKYDSISTVN